MKYYIETASYFYTDSESNKEYLEYLKSLGFEFKVHKVWETGSIEYSIEYNSELTIEINTLEDLQNLIDNVGKIVIDDDTIIIYDDYIE